MNPFKSPRVETTPVYSNRVPFVSISKAPKILKEDTFCYELTGDSVGTVSKVSTVSLLLHADKYARIYGESSMARIAQIMSKPQSSSISSLTDGMTDKEILQSVKPKHIQGITDVTHYVASVNAHAERLNEDFKYELDKEVSKRVAAQQAAAAKTQSTTVKAE